MNKKISFPIAISIIVLCAVLVGGIVVYQYYGMPKEEEETPETIKPPEEAPIDETADWKTYRNEICKFEIKYPERWLMREYSPGRQSHLPEEERTLIISFASNREDLIEEKGVNIFTAPPGISSWQLYMRAENVTCNNEELSVKNIQDLIQEGKVKDYCFTGEKLYLFTIFDTIFKFYIKKEASEEIFNQMLSTFRFIEEEKITIFSPAQGEEWKIGETYQIRWTPINPEENVVIRLYKTPYLSLDLVWEPSHSLPNTGSYSFNVFDWLEPGKKYQFHIVAYSGSGESSYSYRGRSDEFSIVSK